MKKITISGVIGGDTTPEQLRTALTAANGEDVEIVISSPGGFIGAGLEMFNLIRNYSGKTTARLSGYAMSMASYLPLAADRIIAEDNAIIMIHNARGGVIGDHNEILNYGEMTASMSRMFARAYAKHTGQPLEEIQRMMNAETFFFGQDLVDSGFVHELIATDGDDDEQTACTTARMAWESCYAKMTSDVAAVKNDLTRAAALAGTEGSINNQRAPRNDGPAKKGVRMDIKTLQKEHPELVAAVVADAQTGITEQISAATAAGITTGAENERLRITAVRAQLIPGHEALIEQMAFDGQSSGADAAMAIVGAEKVMRQAALTNLTNEAPPVVPAADGGDGGSQAMKHAAFKALSVDEQGQYIRGGGKVID